MKPTAVTWAVLGLLAHGPSSGYDIKRTVDRSIRHFWAASYGQIYPELKRLEEAGWIAGKDADRGGRSRRVYRITAAGRRQLDGWLHGHETRIEMRDESLFASVLRRRPPARRGARAAGGAPRGLSHDARVPAQPRRWAGRGSAVHRSCLSLGPRLLRMGNRMVRSAGTPLAPGRLDDLPEPTWGSMLGQVI